MKYHHLKVPCLFLGMILQYQTQRAGCSLGSSRGTRLMAPEHSDGVLGPAGFRWHKPNGYSARDNPLTGRNDDTSQNSPQYDT